MSQDKPNPNDPIGSDLVREDPSFADIVIQFVEGLGGRLSTMESALAKADYEALRVAAHQLKGSGGGYGYPILTERAGELERFAKAKTLAQCQQLLGDLRSICERIVVN